MVLVDNTLINQNLYNMRKLLLLFSAALTMLFVGCSQFDDSRIWDAIDELEDLFKDLDDRVEELEEACEKMNTNIEALQTLVTALQNHDTITSIAPIKQGDKIIGYTISFSKSEPITIYHGTDGKDGADGEDGKDGADGKDGYAPTIGVAQDEDGAYYWTLDGEWLLDENGNKIKAVGTDGKDGEDGEDGANGNDGSNGENGKDGIAPQLEIRDGYWYISYDNGATWKELGKATGEDGKDGANGADGADGEDGKDGENGKDGADGDSLFQSVTWDEEYAYFTLSDGSVITIPLASGATGGEEEGDLPPANEIWYTSTDGEVVEVYTTNCLGNAAFDAEIISNTYENGKGVITFDNEVTSIGESAFDCCSTLVSVTFSDRVTEIGERAFAFCSSLTNITIPDSVTSIGASAFSSCSNLESITIPDSVTSIGASAFWGCSNLESITIPDSVTSIGDYAFFECVSFESITIPGSVTSIGEDVFRGCSNLASVTIEEGVTSIGDCAFWDCSSLVSIIIPDSVTSIGEHAFSGCTSLTSITIPDSVTSIGDYAFYYCPSLTSVYCKPTTPPSGGGSWMFAGNASGRKIYVPTESVEAYKTADGWSDYADYIEPYNFGGGEGNAGVKEVAAVSLFGMYAVGDNFYVIDGYVSSGEVAGYNPPMDSWNYEFYIISDTEPVNDEIPLGTYTYVDYEKLASGEEELKTGIFTALDMWCTYVDANGEMQEYKYTEGTMVVSEGKIELTVTLDNGEVHHVVYEGSLQTWGEGA